MNLIEYQRGIYASSSMSKSSAFGAKLISLNYDVQSCLVITLFLEVINPQRWSASTAQFVSRAA
jgi:hypothetical protein